MTSTNAKRSTPEGGGRGRVGQCTTSATTVDAGRTLFDLAGVYGLGRLLVDLENASGQAGRPKTAEDLRAALAKFLAASEEVQQPLRRFLREYDLPRPSRRPGSPHVYNHE